MEWARFLYSSADAENQTKSSVSRDGFYVRYKSVNAGTGAMIRTQIPT